ncbi:MAG: hypothetical protein AB7K52_15760 [Phycisphaerales bacterium]
MTTWTDSLHLPISPSSRPTTPRRRPCPVRPATPCPPSSRCWSHPRPPAPYDELGYKVDFDQDGEITPADLADFITAYFSGC